MQTLTKAVICPGHGIFELKLAKKRLDVAAILVLHSALNVRH